MSNTRAITRETLKEAQNLRDWASEIIERGFDAWTSAIGSHDYLLSWSIDGDALYITAEYYCCGDREQTGHSIPLAIFFKLISEDPAEQEMGRSLARTEADRLKIAEKIRALEDRIRSAFLDLEQRETRLSSIEATEREAIQRQRGQLQGLLVELVEMQQSQRECTERIQST